MTIPKSGSLEMWMEAPNDEHPNGYGMGLIEVDPVAISEFNDNPAKYLKNTNGSWKYDTVFFGSWDNNGTQDITEEAVQLLIEFIQSGRELLLGHDTIYHGWTGPKSAEKNPNFKKLMPYLNSYEIPREYWDRDLDDSLYPYGLGDFEGRSLDGIE